MWKTDTKVMGQEDKWDAPAACWTVTDVSSTDIGCWVPFLVNVILLFSLYLKFKKI